MGKQGKMLERLAGIASKLDRAEEHLSFIDAKARAWLAEEESREILPEIDEGKRRYIVSIRLAKPMPPVLPLMVDEVVHHLRSSLDHLASYLVEWSGGQEGRAEWPVVGSPFGWRRQVERRQRRWQIWRKPGGGPLAGASPAVRAFVEGKQPYKRPGKARDDPLFELNDLWNGYKHRVLNPIHVKAVPPDSWRDLFHPTPEIEPIHFRWLVKPRKELKLGAEQRFAILIFPADQPFPKVEMDGEIPMKVFVGDDKRGEFGGLPDDLALIREIVAEATEKFPPSKKA